MKPGVVRTKPRYGHILVVFGLFLSLLTMAFQGVNTPHTIAFGTSEITSLSNQYRANAGLALLTTNAQLTSSAQAKADHMASNSYFAHDAPDGTSPWYFFDSVGYSYTTAGENLALSNQSASSVVDGWYNSPGHRANLLSGSFSEVGYGIAFVPSFTYSGTTYSNVYLVAAHYAQPQNIPVATVASSQAPTPTPAPSQPVAEQTVEFVEEAVVEETPAEQDTKPKSDNPPVIGSTDTDNGTTTSGTLATASTDQPRLSPKIAFVTLGLGLILVIIGSAVEIRRFRRHLPLIPHHR